jgi:putative cell wall-binding protein
VRSSARRGARVLTSLAVIGGATLAIPVAASAAGGPTFSIGATGQATDGTGGYFIAGLVTNTSKTPVSNIDITVTEYNSSGGVLGVDPEPLTTDLVALAAGETGSYSADLTSSDGSLLAGYSHFAVTSVTGQVYSQTLDHNFTVTVTSDVANSDGSHSIVGTIRNNGSAKSDGVQIDLTFFDASNHPVDTDFTFPDNPYDSLAGGASDTFDEEYDGPAYSTVTAVAEGGPGDGGGSSGPPTCDPCISVTRIQGTDRTHTAVAESQDRFGGTGSAAAVVLSRSDEFPDALSGGPLAAQLHAPLLLTSPSELEPVTAAEIVRVAPKGATVYLLGGTDALSPAVEAAVSALGDKVARVSGADRYATAVAIAKLEGNPTTVLEATGLGFADALSGVPAAISLHASILLTDGQAQAPETAAYLASLPTSTRYALGGAAAVADSTATSVAGADRYATSAAVASMFFPAPKLVGLATGTNFPDALGAGADIGPADAPLLLVPPVGSLPNPSLDYLSGVGPGVERAEVFGGPAALSDEVVTAAQNALSLTLG